MRGKINERDVCQRNLGADCIRPMSHLSCFPRQVGTIIEDGLDLPVDDSGSTLGFAFIQFSAKEEAQAAIVKANGYKLDKSHTFIVNSFEDYAKYMAISDVEQVQERA